MSNALEGVIRVRMSSADAHYAGGLVDGRLIAMHDEVKRAWRCDSAIA